MPITEKKAFRVTSEVRVIPGSKFTDKTLPKQYVKVMEAAQKAGRTFSIYNIKPIDITPGTKFGKGGPTRESKVWIPVYDKNKVVTGYAALTIRAPSNLNRKEIRKKLMTPLRNLNAELGLGGRTIVKPKYKIANMPSIVSSKMFPVVRKVILGKPTLLPDVGTTRNVNKKEGSAEVYTEYGWVKISQYVMPITTKDKDGLKTIVYYPGINAAKSSKSYGEFAFYLLSPGRKGKDKLPAAVYNIGVRIPKKWLSLKAKKSIAMTIEAILPAIAILAKMTGNVLFPSNIRKDPKAMAKYLRKMFRKGSLGYLSIDVGVAHLKGLEKAARKRKQIRK